MPTRSSTLRDADQRVKSILDQVTGHAPKEEPTPVKNAAAVALGNLGGMKGGAAGAKALTPGQRSEIAKKDAVARWSGGNWLDTLTIVIGLKRWIKCKPELIRVWRKQTIQL